MVLKFYGFNGSPNVTRVAAILHEKNVPYQYVPLDPAKGEHKAPEYLAKHPFGEVPLIDDDGFILHETWAIVRYICEKYPDQGPELIPQELKKRALFEQAVSIEQSNFHRHTSPIIWEGIVTGLIGLESNQAKLEEAKAALETKLDIYEQILSKQKYLAGDEITLADLMHLGYGEILPQAGCKALGDAEKRPNVVRWFKELQNRPAWQAVKNGPKGLP